MHVHPSSSNPRYDPCSYSMVRDTNGDLDPSLTFTRGWYSGLVPFPPHFPSYFCLTLIYQSVINFFLCWLVFYVNPRAINEVYFLDLGTSNSRNIRYFPFLFFFFSIMLRFLFSFLPSGIRCSVCQYVQVYVVVISWVPCNPTTSSYYPILSGGALHWISVTYCTTVGIGLR